MNREEILKTIEDYRVFREEVLSLCKKYLIEIGHSREVICNIPSSADISFVGELIGICYKDYYEENCYYNVPIRVMWEVDTVINEFLEAQKKIYEEAEQKRKAAAAKRELNKLANEKREYQRLKKKYEGIE